jgi:polysaccharide biosynthesis protein PslG
MCEGADLGCVDTPSRPLVSLRFFAVFFALTLAACVFSPTARPAEPGVVADLNWWITPAERQQTASAVEELGAKWVRLSVQWAYVEPFPGIYDPWQLAETDRAVDIARASGAQVLLMIYNAPSWASGSTGSNVPRDPADFARFAGSLAGRYRGKVSAYEIWNEENYVRFWSTGPNAAAYTQLLRAAYPAVKQADPAAEVVFGGLSTGDYRFVEAAYAAGARGAFDAMAVHPYTYCGTAGPTEIRRERDGRMTRDSFLAYREVRASMLARGDDKPIWLTEFGWNTSSERCDPAAGIWQGGVSEETQANYTSKAFALIQKDRYVQIAIVYSVRNGGVANTPEAQYGLLHRDYSPKPAYDAFKRFATTEEKAPPAPSPTLAAPLS